MKKVAIVGMACRFPGGANSLEEYWQLLVQKKDAIREVPRNRWDIRRFYNKHEGKLGKAYVKEAGFLTTPIYEFDPLFFGITPREAECMDPQQRLLLHSTWEAIEDSGVTLKHLQSLRTGVFVGCFALDHLVTQMSGSNMSLADGSSPTGFTMTVIANRLSHVFDLKGPSIALDTACSSSLVATHLAYQSLLRAESDIAIVAGVNIMTRPEYSTIMSKGHFLSKHGRCKTFDADADGYARGEGVGVVIMKPYDKAIADGDRIYSVIAGSGVNQDGATIGMASPNPDAQEKLIRSVYKKARIRPDDVQYVEAHGTGTKVGDFAETSALGKVFRNKSNGKVFVGSVKTNIGHLEAAAGIAGLIKTSLCIHNGALVPNLHFVNPNPKIDFLKNNLEVCTTNNDWPKLEKDQPKRASINSFGYGGTNAHILLESTIQPDPDPMPSKRNGNGKYLINISARDKIALKTTAGAIAKQINSGHIQHLATLSYNLLFRRSLLLYSFSFWSSSLEDVANTLDTFAKGKIPSKGMQEELTRTGKSKLAFIMTGMGPQWQGMGRELYRTDPLFRATLERCDEIFRKTAGWSLLEEMLKDETNSRMNEALIAQPANFFIQVGITEILKQKGFQPDAFVGHSVGEVSAAYCSGMLSLEDAIVVSYHRSRLHQTLTGSGTMLALGTGEDDARKMIEGIQNVDIAAINSNDTVTLAGEESALKQVEMIAKTRKIFNKFLAVAIPYHSHKMDAIHEEILTAMAGISPNQRHECLYSTVTTEKADSGWDNKYWWLNVRSPVRFRATIATMIADGFDHFVEIGPHSVLKTSLEGIFKMSKAKAYRTKTLDRKEKEIAAIENTSSWLFAHGFEFPHDRLFERMMPHMSLPTYAWQQGEYRRETQESKDYLQGTAGNVFVYRKLPEVYPAWEVELCEGFFPFLEDHVVQNNTVFPGACYVEAGLAIGNALKGEEERIAIEGVDFSNMLIANNKAIQTLKTSYNPETRTYSVHSRVEEDGSEWKLHAKGKIFLYKHLTSVIKDIAGIRQRCQEELNIEDLYKCLASMGLQYGPYFRGIVQMSRSADTVLSRIRGNDKLEWDDNFHVQPVLLDACFQSMIGLVDIEASSTSFVPVHVDELLFFSKPGVEFNCLVEATSISAKEIVGDISLIDDSGRVLVALKGVRCKAIDQKQSNTPDVGLEYGLEWKEQKNGEPVNCIEERVLVITEAEDNEIDKANWLEHFDSVQFATLNNAGDVQDTVDRVVYFLNNRKIGLVRRYKSLRDLLARHGQKLRHFCFITSGAAFIPSVDKNLNCETGAFASLYQVVANEYPHITCKTIDASPDTASTDILNEIASESNDREVALRGSSRFVLEMKRLVQNHKPKKPTLVKAHDAKYALVVNKPGSVEGLEYVAGKEEPLQANQVRVKTLATSLNFKDLLKVYGQISDDVIRGTHFGDTIGMELCGEIVALGHDVVDYRIGEKVYAAMPGCFTTYMNVGTDYLMKIPPHFSDTEAPVMVAFATAYYGLHRIARLEKGEKVLIHTGTGGVGLAAIQIANWLGAEIYTTAGTEVKRKYLRDLGIAHVYDSRSLDFYHEIKEDTGGYGVDVVLNALSGAALEKSFQLLAPDGRFIEIGKKNIAENSGLAMKPFNEGLQFTAIDFDRMAKNRIGYLQQMCDEIFERFAKGDFHPVPVEVFRSDKTKDAFTFMAQSKHVGKVVIDYRDSLVEFRNTTDPFASKQGLVVVTGGAGGFGFQIAKSLVERTGYTVVALSRSGIKDSNDQKTFNEMIAKGCTFHSEHLDVSDKEQVSESLATLEGKYGPLKGIVHSAVVLDDGFIKDLDVTRFSKVLKAKLEGGKNLASYCLRRKKNLDFFVSFSSVSSLIGNPGQANYVVANRYLDLLTTKLRIKGFNAYTINWGVLGESGLLQRNDNVSKLMKGFGLKPLSNRVAIDYFYKTIAGATAQVGIIDIDWKKWSGSFEQLSKNRKFVNLANTSTVAENPLKTELITKLRAMMPEAALSHVLNQVKEGLSMILKLNANKILPSMSVTKLGVDSMMAVEVLVMMEENLFVELTTVDLLNDPTVEKLALVSRDRLLK